MPFQLRLCFELGLEKGSRGMSFGCDLQEDGGCIERTCHDGEQKRTDIWQDLIKIFSIDPSLIFVVGWKHRFFFFAVIDDILEIFHFFVKINLY